MAGLDFLRSNIRWLGAGFLMTFSSSFGQTFFIAFFSGHLRDSFGLSHGELGSLYTIATLASAGTLVWLGKLADTQPLGRLAIVTAIGLALTACAMAAVASPFMLVLVFYGLRFCGQGMLSHIAFTAMGRWYNARRGQAVAIATLGFPAGEALFPIAAVALTVLVGWRGAWLAAAGFLVFVTIPLLLLLLRRNRVPQNRFTDDGSDNGVPRPRDWTRSEVLRDPLFYALLPGLLTPPYAMTGIFFHQAHLVEVNGWASSIFAVSFPIYSCAAVVASLVAGVAIDRWGSGRVLPVYLLPMSIGMALLGLWAEPWQVPVFMGLGGLTTGTAMTLIGALWAEIYGTRHLGSIRALVTAAMVFATGLAPGVMGYLIDWGIEIDVQLPAMAVYSALAAVFFLVLQMTSGRLKRPPKVVVAAG